LAITLLLNVNYEQVSDTTEYYSNQHIISETKSAWIT